jgi:hypothetical protein
MTQRRYGDTSPHLVWWDGCFSTVQYKSDPEREVVPTEPVAIEGHSAIELLHTMNSPLLAALTNPRMSYPIAANRSRSPRGPSARFQRAGARDSRSDPAGWVLVSTPVMGARPCRLWGAPSAFELISCLDTAAMAVSPGPVDWLVGQASRRVTRMAAIV